MNGYEFYWRDPIKGYQIIGTLPERRGNPHRITKESILKWGMKYFGKNLNFDHIFFVAVTLHGTPLRVEGSKKLFL
jgi:hypothetical protein